MVGRKRGVWVGLFGRFWTKNYKSGWEGFDLSGDLFGQKRER